jgi:uncharacterized protein (TIGR03437 family)
MHVALATSSQALQVPSTAFISEGQTSVTFQAQAGATDQDQDVVLTASVSGQSSATPISLRAIKPSALSCESKSVVAGGKVTCSLELSAAAVSDSLTFSLASSSASLLLPAQLSTRTGQRHLRFVAIATAESAPESVTISAQLFSASVQETIAIMPAGALDLSAPSSVVGRPGSPVHFTASAKDGQDIPLPLSVSGQPASASFNAQDGDFTWLPSNGDLGRHLVTFTATNATGTTASKTTLLEIESGRPSLARLENAAGSSAVAGCTPRSLATLIGRFSTDNADGPTLLVNGDLTPIASADDTHVSFVCPALEDGAPLQFQVKTDLGESNPLHSEMHDAAPGIFTIDGSGSGQAIAWRSDSTDLAVIPTFRNQGKPALSGDKISVLVTGINCSENSSAEKLLISLSNTSVSVDSLTASARKAGACEIGFTVPDGVAGDAVPLTLGVIRSDGRSLTSNAASIAIGNER